MQRITVKNIAYQQIEVKNPLSQNVGVKNSYTIIGTFDPYIGNYRITPTDVQQTLLTKGKGMVENVVIEPIPNNYGLVTYNGFELTIS